MNDLQECMERLLAEVLEGEERGQDDYTGPDGLLYCGNCRTKKQHRVTIFGKERIVPVLCACEAEKRKRELEELEKKERIDEIRRAKNACIHDKALINCTFENDDGSLPLLASARRYVETWPRRKENNNGLLLWGDVGTGKSFYAACIANALIEEGVSVMMTNFAKILNRMSGMYSEDTVIDRTIQQAMAQQMIPIFEPLFSDGSFGYRPGRSAKDAILKVKEYAEQGYTHAVSLDL